MQPKRRGGARTAGDLHLRRPILRAGLMFLLASCGGNPPVQHLSEFKHGLHPDWVQRGRATDFPERKLDPVLLHDGQQIVDGNQEYGGFYAVVAAVNSSTEIPLGLRVHVATVEVSGRVVGAARFQEGLTCVMLSRQAGNDGDVDDYTAHLMRPVRGTADPLDPPKCAAATDAYDTIEDVRVERFPSSTGEYPPAARWTSYRTEPYLALGVGCDLDWCTIGPPAGENARILESVELFDDDVARSMNPALYDVQDVAMQSGEVLVPTMLRARIAPIDTLALIDSADFKNSWVHVATITLADEAEELQAPGLEQYKNSWEIYWHRWLRLGFHDTMELKPGMDIRVELMLDDSGDWWGRYTRKWEGWFGLYFYYTKSERIPVVRVRHPVGDKGARQTTSVQRLDGPPGSARWGWIPADEAIWVRCANGCCELSFRYGLG